ncbi:hypothetical protein JL720_12481 [Aureococcus anophagefferens]|nr:hypothetical protein JL720_12481 [Aureococcus anophagefferens]
MTEEQHQSSSSLDSSGAFDAGAAQDFAGEAREHVVVPGDTLAGLCLKYAVSARALRTLNKLDGDNVQGVAVLAIPPSPAGRPAPVQAQTRDVVARRLRCDDAAALEDCVARLEARDWDFGACVAAHEAENDPSRPRRSARRRRRRGGALPPAVALSPDGRAARKVVVHLDLARGLYDIGVLASMDVRRRASSLAPRRRATAPRFELFAPNELLPDSPLGKTQPLP